MGIGWPWCCRNAEVFVTTTMIKVRQAPVLTANICPIMNTAIGSRVAFDDEPTSSITRQSLEPGVFLSFLSSFLSYLSFIIVLPVGSPDSRDGSLQTTFCPISGDCVFISPFWALISEQRELFGSSDKVVST